MGRSIALIQLGPWCGAIIQDHLRNTGLRVCRIDSGLIPEDDGNLDFSTWTGIEQGAIAALKKNHARPFN